jgi:hypothetical protein
MFLLAEYIAVAATDGTMSRGLREDAARENEAAVTMDTESNAK